MNFKLKIVCYLSADDMLICLLYLLFKSIQLSELRKVKESWMLKRLNMFQVDMEGQKVLNVLMKQKK